MNYVCISRDTYTKYIFSSSFIFTCETLTTIIGMISKLENWLYLQVEKENESAHNIRPPLYFHMLEWIKFIVAV